MKKIYLYPIILFLLCFSEGCVDNMPVRGPYPQVGVASWYNANNELACAMRKIDFGKNYKVCNINNDKCIVVIHNDFGPKKHLYNRGIIIDLTKYAFAQLADLSEGIINVKIEEVKKQ